MGKILPFLLALVGLGLGLGAGVMLRPAPETPVEAEAAAEHVSAEPKAPPDYVKLNNQFVVPLVDDGRVASLVVLSLSLEVSSGHTADVYAREPKLRDAFLQVLFDHANTGGFRGSFTDGSNLVLLRQALKEKATSVAGDLVTDVLITEIARQDS